MKKRGSTKILFSGTVLTGRELAVVFRRIDALGELVGWDCGELLRTGRLIFGDANVGERRGLSGVVSGNSTCSNSTSPVLFRHGLQERAHLTLGQQADLRRLIHGLGGGVGALKVNAGGFGGVSNVLGLHHRPAGRERVAGASSPTGAALEPVA